MDFGLARGGRALIAHEMGLGKTVTALALMKQYATAWKIPRRASSRRASRNSLQLLRRSSGASRYRSDWPLLILAPKAVLTQWEEEVARWVSPAPAVQVIKKGKDKLKAADVYILTHDLFARAENAHLRAAPRGPWRAIIVDESHKCKDPSSKRTKAIRTAALRAQRVALLTGTPYVTGANDLQPQLEMALKPGALYHLPGFRDWERRYCERSEIHTGFVSIERWSGTNPQRCELRGSSRGGE